MIIDTKIKKSNLKEPNIISVGRLHQGKRIDELIEIFSELKNNKSKLFIIGDGKEKENLQNLITKLNLNDRILF